MKKTLTILIALATALSFASCKKAAPDESKNISGPVSVSVNGTGASAAGKQSGNIKVDHTVDGDFLVFKVSCNFALESDAWVGICAKGDYLYEDDADDAEFSYSYYEDRQSEDEPYIFKIDFNDMDDATYSVVLCDTDNNGYVIASWHVTLSGGKATVDYSNFKINEKPAVTKPAEEPAYEADEDEDYGEDDFDYPDDTGEYDGDEEEPDDGADDA
ncbi:MAG: hypothetical protein J6W36_06385 [Clostridiales bacterium]|nr:hypothetical protein [Clostridiales bacterium]